MLSPTPTTAALPLPALDLRALARRMAIPAALVAVAIAFLLLAGGQARPFTHALGRALHLNPMWAGIALMLETLSIAGYVTLLWMVAGRRLQRVGLLASAEITLAGTAATRLLPTAGAGGAALTLWALRRAGLSAGAATRTLLGFLVVLYAVFLSSIALAGSALLIGIGADHAPTVFAAAAAAGAAIAILVALALARWPGGAPRGPIGAAAQMLGCAVRDAAGLVRSGDLRLLGAPAYWLLDAAVVWAMLRAFGVPASVPVVTLAYFAGQVANTLPVPGSVSGGIAGVLIACGVPVQAALPAVLAYRAVAIWLPSPFGVLALSRLRRRIASWDVTP